MYAFMSTVLRLHSGEPLRIHRQSMYLVGRDEKVCDLPVAHPSCSKQHAVIQFRQVRPSYRDTVRSVCSCRCLCWSAAAGRIRN